MAMLGWYKVDAAVIWLVGMVNDYADDLRRSGGDVRPGVVYPAMGGSCMYYVQWQSRTENWKGME